MSFPRFSLLSQYVTRGVLLRSGAALLVLMVVFISIDLVETTALVGGERGAVVLWYLLKLPSVAGLLLPLALTLGGVLQVSSLKNSDEWNAMSGSGVSPWKSFARLLAAPFGITLLAIPLYTHLGPGGLALFSGKVAPVNEEAAGQRDDWFLWNRRFVKLDRKTRQGTIIERERGQALARYDFSLGAGAEKALVWREGEGYHREPLPDGLLEIPRPPAAEPAAPGVILTGAALTAPKLADRIESLRAAGYPTAPYEAEQALRVALVLACFLLPFGALIIALGTTEARATRLTGIAILSAVLFWLLTATAWNGALLDIWPPWTVSLGAPALYLVLTLTARLGLGRLGIGR